MWWFALFFVPAVRSIVVYKCCANGTVLSPESVCVPSASLWHALFYSQQNQNFLLPGTRPADYVEQVKRPVCDAQLTYLQLSELVITVEDGSLFTDKYQLLNAEEYCISEGAVLVCLQQKHRDQAQIYERSVKKCCSLQFIYDLDKMDCVRDERNASNFLSENTIIYTSFPPCASKEHAIAGKLDEGYSLNMDGTLAVANTGKSLSDYCVEYVIDQPGVQVFTCAERRMNDIGGPFPNKHDLRFTLYPIGLFVSVFFLALTLVASFMLPASHHALHWKCQTHYVACLLVGDFLLAIAQVSDSSLKMAGMCVLVATAMHFFFLSAFFWLNTMCFNIWWTFRDLRPTSLDKAQETYRLVLYELYAWGGPLIIVAVGAIMDQWMLDSHPILRPRFGHHNCWFYGDAELFVYFFGPVGLLLFVNLILFLATTRELTCGLWKREVVKSNTERTTLSHICLKLVVVMGITWIMDIVSWAVGGPAYVWYIPDLVNALQGVFIFIVVGCQPQVWIAVKRLWCLPESNRSSSSNAVPSIINDQSTVKQAETLC